MNQHRNPNKELYYRLIALWVVCEAFAGGIMHGAKIPFTGMIVSALAVTCIILIAWYVPGRSAILQATLIVAVFKLLLSPHSPPTAYIAVFFQGYLGHLLFYQRRYFTAAAIVLSVLSLVESSIQRILVLLLIYGNSFWEAVNQYIQKLAGGKSHNYSLLLASAYILLHAIAGVFTGVLAVRLAKRSESWKENGHLLIRPVAEISAAPARRRRKIKVLFVIIWILLLLLFIHSFVDPAHSVLPAASVWRIVLRSVLIVLTWYFLLAPLVMQLLKRVLRRQQEKQKEAAAAVMELLPQTKYIFTQSWALSAKQRGIKRLKLFLKILVVNILTERKGQHENLT